MSEFNQEWIYFPDDKLLKMKICDLGLTIDHSELKEHTDQLTRELENRGIPLKPKFYLGDEWFSPEGVVAIAIPFYLAHPRLKALEQSQMYDVEGGTPESCMKLLRHETGHCFDHAFQFSKRKKWKSTFGSPEKEYDPDHYRAHPYSKSFVKHIPNGYAQSHPDEDFAETFAVWLTPTLDWRREYEAWAAALKKLLYIDELSKEVIEKNLKNKINFKIPTKKDLPYSADRMKSTLETYYLKRKRENAHYLPDYFDVDLKYFLKHHNGESFEKYLKKNKKWILETVHHWTGETKISVDELLNRISKRAKELDLRVPEDIQKTNIELCTFLSSILSNFRYTGRYKPRV